VIPGPTKHRDPTVDCPACGVSQQIPMPDVVNPDRARALCAEIVAGTFGRYQCAACGAWFRVERSLWYLDVPRHRVIRCFPSSAEREWRSLESEPQSMWQRVVDIAPAALRIDPERGFVRAVFGLPALREKLICLEREIDDRVLEAFKLDLCRGSAGLTLGWRSRPRLVGVDAEKLELAVPRRAPGASARGDDVLAASVERLERIAGERNAWSALIELLSRGPYVDLGRILPPVPEPSAA